MNANPVQDLGLSFFPLHIGLERVLLGLKIPGFRTLMLVASFSNTAETVGPSDAAKV